MLSLYYKDKTAICLPTDSCFLVFPDFLIYEFLSVWSLPQRCQGSATAEYEKNERAKLIY